MNVTTLTIAIEIFVILVFLVTSLIVLAVNALAYSNIRDRALRNLLFNILPLLLCLFFLLILSSDYRLNIRRRLFFYFCVDLGGTVLPQFVYFDFDLFLLYFSFDFFPIAVIIIVHLAKLILSLPFVLFFCLRLKFGKVKRPPVNHHVAPRRQFGEHNGQLVSVSLSLLDQLVTFFLFYVQLF